MSDVTIAGGSQLPAHIAAMFGATTNEDLTAGVSGGYPILSYRGKTWALVQSGERNVIMRDGDPVPAVEVVIIKSNPNISKIYYPDGYEEGSTDKPTCYSNDGIAPGLDAEDRQAAKCGVCPHNVWGSRITENGAKGKACADLRRLAVAPAGDLENPMLLRVPAASLRGLVEYANTLQKRNTPYQALVTKIGFDHEAAYPKMVFKPVRWLEPDEATKVLEVMNSDVVGQITTLNMAAVAREAEPKSALDADLDAMGAPPVQAQASNVEPMVKPKPRTKASVGAAEVAAAVAAAPAPAATQSDMFSAAPAAQPAPAKAAPPPSQAEPSTLVVTANDELDKALADLDLDD